MPLTTTADPGRHHFEAVNNYFYMDKAFPGAKRRIRTESLSWAVSVSGKRNFAARENRPETAPCTYKSVAECPPNRGYSEQGQESPDALDCVVSREAITILNEINALDSPTCANDTTALGEGSEGTEVMPHARHIHAWYCTASY